MWQRINTLKSMRKNVVIQINFYRKNNYTVLNGLIQLKTVLLGTIEEIYDIPALNRGNK